MARTILIIEDSRTQALRLELELKRAGYRVQVCADGAAGVMKARAVQPDAIILDINLPSMNGYAVCQMLKSDSKTAAIPIIMLSNRSQPTDEQAAVELGAYDYIHKDAFSEKNIIRALHQLDLMAA